MWAQQLQLLGSRVWHSVAAPRHELDPTRRRQLLSYLDGIQTLVTCTDMDDLAGAEVGQAWRVAGAKLTPL